MGCGASTGKLHVVTQSVSVQTSMVWDRVPLVKAEEEIDCTTENGAVGGFSTPGVKDKKNHGERQSNFVSKKDTDVVSPEDAWLEVCEGMEKTKIAEDRLIVKRSGWKTVRIFVSSTFKDFHRERELLVKEVFPDLRIWCENRCLHLVDCDLRWGVPKDSTTELTLRTCLGEIDRCYQDNIMPYFLNMTGERIGWIPLETDVPGYFAEEYRWVFGLSMTEMEIVHGAYRKDNPNSLFMIRNDDFLNTVPEDKRKEFIDEQEVAKIKLQVLKEKVKDRFPSPRVILYNCEYDGSNPETGRVSLKVEDKFKESVLKFFQERISWQYPLSDLEEDPYQKMKDSHESFMTSKAEMVLGRENTLKQIGDYLCGIGHDVPLVLLGGPGTGKSSIMARAVREALKKALAKQIPGGGKTGWNVSYHFVGAVPGSTDLETTLKRLLKEMGAITDESQMPKDLEATVQMSCSTFNNTSTKPTIIFIDALNQFDAGLAAEKVTWIPRKLAPQIRCVFSMIDDTPPHKSLTERESRPVVINVKPLDLEIRKDMVTEFLGKFNKRLDMDQMFNLLTKQSSENPLWLSIACEELRVFGDFRKISDKINSLADGLLELLQQVLSRFEQEGGGNLLGATLCLLEVSITGLLESELLLILADEDNLLPNDEVTEKGEREKSEKEKYKPIGNLPAAKWAGVYRSLRPFLRPFGDSGEGRLDFYHRSLSKAVRKKYLKTDGNEEASKKIYKWWHTKLADYFEHSDNWDRKVEEYPHHLISLKDTKRLNSFLLHWEVFDRLYDREFAGKLLKYWRECGEYSMMLDAYTNKLLELREGSASKEEIASRSNKVARILIQAGIYDESLALAEDLLEMEKKDLGSRQEQLAELYSLLSHVWDQKVKIHEFVGKEQIPDERKCIEYNKQSIAILRKLKGKHNEMLLGKQLMKLGFSLASFHDCGGDSEINPKQALEQGNKVVDEAIKIFEKNKDTGLLAECFMTKAVLMRHDFNGQIKYYTNALDMCLEAYGQYHVLTGRIYMNTGIAYEDARNYTKAYELFKKNYFINLEVYGPGHLKTDRSKGILTEPTYVRVRINANDTIPGL